MLLHQSMPSHTHVLPRSSQRSPSTGPTTASARLTSTNNSRSARSTPSASPSRPSSPLSSVEQSFHLSAAGCSTPWLTMRVGSNASPSKAHPLYFDRDSVEGSVCLNLTEQPMSIVAIVVIVSYSATPPNSPLPGNSSTFSHAQTSLGSWTIALSRSRSSSLS
jgi:hypothetical protein